MAGQCAWTAESLTIAVLSGGQSSEREVSLESGRSVAAELQARGHRVRLLDPADTAVTAESLSGADIVLPMLHGTGGEDGTLQQQLQALRVPWVGSSPAASALTFDKAATRRRLSEHRLRVPAGVALGAGRSWPQVRAAARQLGYPLVVKPAAQGSSVGVSIVRNADELQPAVELAGACGPVLLLEQFIAGREVTVPVVNGLALPVIEILPSRPWYDYTAKYHDAGTQYVVHPQGLPADLVPCALRACGACGVTGISRVDLRVHPGGRCYLLEINSIPGMTSHSLVPMSAAALGLSLGELCERACRQALADWAQAAAGTPPVSWLRRIPGEFKESA